MYYLCYHWRRSTDHGTRRPFPSGTKRTRQRGRCTRAQLRTTVWLDRMVQLHHSAVRRHFHRLLPLWWPYCKASNSMYTSIRPNIVGQQAVFFMQIVASSLFHQSRKIVLCNLTTAANVIRHTGQLYKWKPHHDSKGWTFPEIRDACSNSRHSTSSFSPQLQDKIWV